MKMDSRVLRWAAFYGERAIMTLHQLGQCSGGPRGVIPQTDLSSYFSEGLFPTETVGKRDDVSGRTLHCVHIRSKEAAALRQRLLR
jgi:hypothetical protein